MMEDLNLEPKIPQQLSEKIAYIEKRRKEELDFLDEMWQALKEEYTDTKALAIADKIHQTKKLAQNLGIILVGKKDYDEYRIKVNEKFDSELSKIS